MYCPVETWIILSHSMSSYVWRCSIKIKYPIRQKKARGLWQKKQNRKTWLTVNWCVFLDGLVYSGGGKLKYGSDTLFLATKLKIATTSFRKLGWVSLCYKTWIWYVINCLTAARKRYKHLEKQQNKTKHTSAGDRTPRFGRQSCCIQGIVGKAGKNDFATFLR